MKLHYSFYKELQFEFYFYHKVGKRVNYKSVTNDVKVKYVEESIEGDVLFNANTTMFKQFMGDSLNAKGAVQVNDYIQVQYGKYFREHKKRMIN